MKSILKLFNLRQLNYHNLLIFLLPVLYTFLYLSYLNPSIISKIDLLLIISYLIFFGFGLFIVIEQFQRKLQKYLYVFFITVFYFFTFPYLDKSFLELNLLLKFFIFLVFYVSGLLFFDILKKFKRWSLGLAWVILIAGFVYVLNIVNFQKNIAIDNGWSIISTDDNGSMLDLAFDHDYNPTDGIWSAHVNLDHNTQFIQLKAPSGLFVTIKDLAVIENRMKANTLVAANDSIQSDRDNFTISGTEEAVLNISKKDKSSFDRNIKISMKLSLLRLKGNDVTFTSRPDIYVILPDSLFPSTLSKKWLNFDILDFLPSLKDFTFFKNSFSDNFPTNNSLNTTLASGNKIFDQLGGVVYPSFELGIFDIQQNGKYSHQMNYLSGKTPSVFFDLLNFNNYKITTGTSTGHLVHTKGPYIDNLHLFANNSFCQTVPVEQKFILFGYCRIHGFLTGDRFQSKSLIQNYADNLIEINKQHDSPKFNFIHLYTPGHASPKYYHHDKKDQRASFIEFFQSRLVETDLVLNDLINNIKKNTKNKDGFVVLIFGDHAPWLSANTALDDQQFFVEGRFAVLGACYDNKDYCQNIKQGNKLAGFITPATAIKFLMNSLTSKKIFNVEDLASEHYLNMYFKIYKNFKEFAYE